MAAGAVPRQGPELRAHLVLLAGLRPARSVNTHQRLAVVVSQRIRHRRRGHAGSYDLINGLT